MSKTRYQNRSRPAGADPAERMGDDVEVREFAFFAFRLEMRLCSTRNDS